MLFCHHKFYEIFLQMFFCNFLKNFRNIQANMKYLAAIFSLSLLFSCSGEKFTTIDNGDFAEKLQTEAVQLVDVRTAAEFAAGHIPGAMNIDVKSAGFDSECEKLDKTRDVAVYCRSGVRSKTAAGKLARKGFTVYNLKNGITGWNGEVVKN